MKVTSINSTTSDFVLDVIPAYTAGWTFLQIGRAGINVKTADLLAALDATANTEITGMRRDLIAAENAADEWKARAEKAEAALTEAKAALGRVEALSFGDNELIHASDLYAAIQPKPAFTLPTEAGARFEALYGSEWETYTTYSDGNGGAIYRGDCGFNDGDYIMRCYADHRLIGAES